jgi:hypothetical protein
VGAAIEKAYGGAVCATGLLALFAAMVNKLLKPSTNSVWHRLEDEALEALGAFLGLGLLALLLFLVLWLDDYF